MDSAEPGCCFPRAGPAPFSYLGQQSQSSGFRHGEQVMVILVLAGIAASFSSAPRSGMSSMFAARIRAATALPALPDGSAVILTASR